MNMRAALGVALAASTLAAGSMARVAVPDSTARRPTKGGGMIPDRVSIEEGSEFYFPLSRSLGVRVDGIESDSVVEFCKSEGWVRICQRNPDGRMKRERGRIVTTTHQSDDIEPYWRGGSGDRRQVAPPPPERPQAGEHQHRGEIARRLRQKAAREAKEAQRAAAR